LAARAQPTSSHVPVKVINIWKILVYSGKLWRFVGSASQKSPPRLGAKNLAPIYRPV